MAKQFRVPILPSANATAAATSAAVSAEGAATAAAAAASALVSGPITLVSNAATAASCVRSFAA